LFAARELSPSAVEWIDWNWRRLTGATEDLLKALTEMRDGAAETTIVRNIAQVSGRVLDRFVPLNHLEIRQQTFDGDMLRGRQYQRIRFAECEFWHLDLTGTELLRCDFTSCKFGDIHVDAATSMEGSTFDETTSIVSVDSVDGATAFAPDQIVGRLIGMGAMVTAPPEPTPPVKPRVRSDVTLCVEKYVKASERTCDVAVEDLEEDFGKVAIVVATLGLECGVLREITKGVRGPKKRFVRFRVDRERLLRGQVGSIGDTEIDTFWAALEKKYPA
jgi:hypothetical protein